MTTTLISTFDSIDEVMAVCEKPLPADSCQASRENEGGESWDLGLGYSGAWDAYCGGWAEGAAKAYELAETLKPKPRGPRTALRRNVAGAFPNVGAYLSGAPNAMYQPCKRDSYGKPFVQLYMPIAYSCAVKAETAFDRGCALVALADALETAGCRVRITGVDASSFNGDHEYYGLYLLKDYGDRLEVDSLIFTVAHPAFFRRLVFAHRERSPHKPVRDATHMGYGMACEVPDRVLPQDAQAITVKFPELGYGDRDTPEGFLQKMVSALPESLQTEIGGE